jgi:eukaryotic-like serine/threonine-protein kinase
MITRRGVVKVMDFGIARAMQSGVTSMTQTGMVVGTPQYLSPEQALGRGVDARSDLYSVGCMLFELLTGRLPFDGDSPLSVAYQHVQTEPPVPSSINRSLPPAVDALVARALKKNPEDRFPTAEAMQDECLRVAGSAQGQAATPLVISEGPKARHGYQQPPDSFAVFPNASTSDPHTPAPYPSQGQHTPPHLNQGQQHTPPPQMHQGPPTPPPQMNYGRPTPPPQNYAPIGYQTPPPPAQHMAPAYPQSPQMAPRSGSNWKPLVIFAIIAVVVAVVLLAIIGALTDDNKDNSDSDSGYDSSSSSSTPSPAVTMGDPSQTISASECTGAIEGSTDGTVELPELKFTYIDSVKQCLDAAGWSYREVPTDEHLFGKGMVIDTNPSPFTSFDPKNTKIVLYVSTGKLD